MKNIDIFFALLRNVFSDETVNEQVKQEAEEKADKLYQIAKYHDLAHLLSCAFEKAGVQVADEELKKKISKDFCVSVVRYERIAYEQKLVCGVFEENGIVYLPLKGAVVREMYPEPWMRTSCDFDVLVKEDERNAAAKILTEQHGFVMNYVGNHDVSLTAESGTHLELHYKLNEALYVNPADELLKNVWDMTETVPPYSYRRRMSDELYYYYHIYHMAKHFEIGGCGIRPFLDLWFLNHKMDFDKNKRDELLEKGGIKKFEESCRELSEYWFSGDKETELILRFQAFILNGGTYGNKKNGVALRQTKRGGKFQYILDRVFMPYDMLKVHYPILEKHKYLTPVFEVVRWCKLLNPVTYKRSKRELKLAENVTDERTGELSVLLSDIGLLDNQR